ncbi:Uncharacterised protein [Bordetella pertussis]|nr:Uncharacterised protein [Bordetella pertussis]
MRRCSWAAQRRQWCSASSSCPAGRAWTWPHTWQPVSTIPGPERGTCTSTRPARSA